MNTEQLISEATKIPPPGISSYEEYKKNRETMVQEINLKLTTCYNLTTLIGGVANADMMKDNHSNHARFMENLFSSYDGKTLVETIIWAFRSYTAHGFPNSYWSAQYSNWCEVLKKHLSEKAFSEIIQVYNFIIVRMPALFEEAARPKTQSTTDGASPVRLSIKS